MAQPERIQAIQWWDRKSTQLKDALTVCYYPNRELTSLTGREIQNIWFKETLVK